MCRAILSTTMVCLLVDGPQPSFLPKQGLESRGPFKDRCRMSYGANHA